MKLKELEEPILLITKNSLNLLKLGNKEIYEKDDERERG